MSSASARPTKPEAARVGRPPSVSVPQIVAAAIELGLDKVTLKQIADHLQVAPATLYRHVHNRDELLRLAAFQLTLMRKLPDDTVGHWSELALRYAETLLESFLAEPQLLSELLRGRIGPHVEVDILEQFLSAVARHGFSAAEGAQLFHAIGTVVIGAATGLIGSKASLESDAPWPQAMRAVLAERDAEELPQVRQLATALAQADSQWQFVMHNLLAGIAAARGERLPLRDVTPN